MLLAIGHFCIKNDLTFFIWSNGSEKTRIFLLIKYFFSWYLQWCFWTEILLPRQMCTGLPQARCQMKLATATTTPTMSTWSTLSCRHSKENSSDRHCSIRLDLADLFCVLRLRSRAHTSEHTRGNKIWRVRNVLSTKVIRLSLTLI